MRRIEYDELPQPAKDRLRALPILDPEDRLPAWRGFVARYPAFEEGRLDFARDLLQLGHLEEARVAYEDVARDWPDSAGAEAGLATVASAAGDHDLAMRLATSALERGYDWSECHAVLARGWLQRGEGTEAAQAFLRAYERNPHGWPSLEQHCVLLGRDYRPPGERLPLPFPRERLEHLLSTVEAWAQADGCNHTLRLSRRYAEENGLDPVDFYQFLNSHGAFCDCEVCSNVEDSVSFMLGEDDED